MSDSRNHHNYAVLGAEVEGTSRIESELELLFYLKPLNQDELVSKLCLLARGDEGSASALIAEYPLLEFNPEDIRRRIDALEHGPAAGLGTLWNMRIQQLERMLALMEARGTGSFTQIAIAEYGEPDPELVSWAESILSDPAAETELLVAKVAQTPHQLWPVAPPPVQALEVDAKAAREYLEDVIRYYKLEGVDVRISDRLTARAMVEGGRLWLRHDILFSEDLLRRLAVHEVGIHLRRRALRPLTQHPLLEMESPHGSATEEGLTVLTEARAGCLEPEVLHTYAGRVVAIDMSLAEGAYIVMNSLVDHGFEPEEAATLVVRAKRGTADFSQQGAFTKDLCYLVGVRIVLDYIHRGGSVTPLFDCLLGIEDLPYLPPGIHDPFQEREAEEND